MTDAELRPILGGEGTVLAAFERACRAHPQHPAVLFLGTRLRFVDLERLVQRFSAACPRLGIVAGDRVLLYLPNCPQWLVAYLALQTVGAVPVPVSPIYAPRELRFLVDNAGAKAVVCADTNYGHVQEALAGAQPCPIVVTRILDLLPIWKRLLAMFFDLAPTGKVARNRHIFSFRALLRRRDRPPAPVTIDPTGHLAHILYTGGTTGVPKGVPHTHMELLSGIVGLRELYRSQIDDASEALVLPLPMFHMFTQDMLFALGLHRANTLIILPRPLTDAVLAAVARHRGTLLIGVPSLYRKLLDNERFELYDLSSLRYCWSAGDILPAETAAEWQARVGLPIHQVYGSTETVCISATRLDAEPAAGRLGRLIPTRRARIVDPETAAPLPSDAAGELLVGSPYSYHAGGYWRNEVETGQAYVTVDGERWCRTGDIVRWTPDDELEFVDRRADMIKYKGFRVSASRVESVLQDHPAVVAAAVVGTPDPETGEKVKAFVILARDVRGVTAFDLLRHCRERLLPYEVPDYVEFRDMLPKSKVGKLLRRELKAEERRRVQG